MNPIEVETHSTIRSIDAEDWNACACPEAATGRAFDPFTTHAFLSALEASGSVGPGTGWHPFHLAARANGQIIAVAPLYAKGHSQGEYIFDHSWADAWQRAGGRYYPKLQIAVPFTPVTGRRLLTRPGWEYDGRAALVQAAIETVARNGFSSLHITFCKSDEAASCAKAGLLKRTSQQYHWLNRNYGDFEGFLAELSSRKRKMIRKERATAQGFGGTIRRLTGDQIKPEHWDAFWQFYQDTGNRKWGHPYLTRGFFDAVHQAMRDDILLVLAERAGRPVAGALNFIGRDALFGRYWGATEDHPCLHFECCYYQAIDHAIALGLTRVEAGAQGEHKIARGYMPAECHSAHWIADPGFRDAVSRFLEQERTMVGSDIAALAAFGPFRKVDQG